MASCRLRYRLVQTATVVAETLGASIQLDPRLREINFGLFEGLTEAEALLNERFKSEWQAWRSRGRSVAPAHVEQPLAVIERGAAFLSSVLDEGVTVVVSHGPMSRAMIVGLVGVSPEKYRMLRQDAGGVSVIRGEWGEAQLICHNVPLGVGVPEVLRSLAAS